jgi:hypothetical protein
MCHQVFAFLPRSYIYRKYIMSKLLSFIFGVFLGWTTFFITLIIYTSDYSITIYVDEKIQKELVFNNIPA